MSVAMSPILLLCAWLLDLLAGDPQGNPHPVVWIGRLIVRLEPLCLRLTSNRRLAGILLTFSTLLLVGGSAWCILEGARLIHPMFHLLLWVWLGYACLATRALHVESAIVAAALRAGDLAAARQALARLVSRDTNRLDEAGIYRALCETVAENTADGVVAPLFFLALGGPVAALVYKAASTLDSMVGYRTERYLLLGWASARLDDLLNLIPARLTALLMAVTAPLVGLSGWQALRMALRDGGKTSSPNAGLPMAAAAGALGVRLGGAAVYFGEPVEKPTLGDPRHPIGAADYRGVVRLLYAVSFAMLLLALVLATYFGGGWE